MQGPQQTSPKWAPAATQARRGSPDLRSQVAASDRRHTCGASGATEPGSASAHLAERPSAVRKFLSSISVEPLAFIAMLSIYIEFPTTQDLIYTKVCLQVISGQNSSFSQPSTPQPWLNDSSAALASNLSSNGRIGGPAGASGQPINIQLPLASLLGDRAHAICDRLDRSAVPAELRQQIAAQDSLFWLRYQIIVCVLCAITVPYWGGVSDRVGRLTPLNVAISSTTLSNLASLLFGLLISLNSHQLFRPEWLYCSAVLNGLSGGQAVLIVNSFSYLSDHTSVKSRSKRVTLLEAVIFLSHSLGFLASRNINTLGLASPQRVWLNRHVVAFAVCIALNLICILYAALCLRHQRFHRFLNNYEREQQENFAGEPSHNQVGSTTTLPVSVTSANLDIRSAGPQNAKALATPSDLTGMPAVERARELTSSTPDDIDGPIAKSDRGWRDWDSVFTLEYFSQTYETATKPRESRHIVLLLLLCGFISALSLTSLLSLQYVYLRMEPFNWSTSQYSAWNSVSSMSRGSALVLLSIAMRFVTTRTVLDPLVAALGFASKAAGLFMLGLATASPLVQWSLVGFACSEFSMPPIRSLLSKLVGNEELAKIYSCLGTMQSLCFLAGNVLFYFAFTSVELASFFRLCFISVGGVQVAAVIIMLYIYIALRRRIMIV